MSISKVACDASSLISSWQEGDYLYTVTRSASGKPLTVSGKSAGRPGLSAEFRYTTQGKFAGIVGNIESSVMAMLSAEAAGPVLGALGWIPATNDSAGIAAAEAAALAKGGGVVQFLPVDYTLTAPIVPKSGITYRGVAPSFSYPINPPDSVFSYAAGTRLKGDGTFAAFSYNDVDRGSTNPIFGSDALSNTYIDGFTFKNFTRAISIGAVNACGMIHGGVSNLWIEDCTDWAVFMANFMHCDVNRIFSQNCRNGQYYGALVAGLTLMPGNSKFHTLFNIVPTAGTVCPDPRLHRRIVFEAGGTAAKLNEMDVQRAQCNSFTGTQLSVSASTTNGSANITVPDGTKFAVGMPVMLPAGGQGFNALVQYFVKTLAGNVITIATSRTGAAVSATGTGSVTLTTRGFPNLEITSRNTGAAVSNSFFYLDSEGTAGAGVYLENAQAVCVKLTEVPSTAECDSTIVARAASYCEYSSKNNVTVDLDSGSAVCHAFGLPITAIRDVPPVGVHWDGTLGRSVLSLARFSTATGVNYTLANRSPGNGDFTEPGLAMGNAVYTSTSTSQNINMGIKASVAVYKGTGAATWTWVQNASAEMVGYTLTLKNRGTGTLTFALGGTGNGDFDGLTGHNSLTLNAPTGTTPGGVATIVQEANGSWSILSLTNGAVV